MAGDMRDWGLDNDPSLAVYLPYYGGGMSPVYFVIHGSATPASLRPVLRQALGELDSGSPSPGAGLQERWATLWRRDVSHGFVAAFEGVALLLRSRGYGSCPTGIAAHR